MVGTLGIAKRARREDSIRLCRELTVCEVRGALIKDCDKLDERVCTQVRSLF